MELNESLEGCLLWGYEGSVEFGQDAAAARGKGMEAWLALDQKFRRFLRLEMKLCLYESSDQRVQ